jgi:hypothetical protein
MKKQKGSMGQKRRTEKIRLIICLGFFVFFSAAGLSRGNDWEPLPWGLNLEELNQAFKEKYKNGEIREDKDRLEIELQYSPTRSVKFTGGKLKALLSSTDTSLGGHLYGYSYDGKFFGKVMFFRDYPQMFPETVIKILKEKYPQGRVYQNFTMSRPTPIFEYKSDQLYVFSTTRGVFYYEPGVLNRIAKIQQGEADQAIQRQEQEIRDKNVYAP